MEIVKAYYKEDILKLTRKRSGEEKIGEQVECVLKEWKTDLRNSKTKLPGLSKILFCKSSYFQNAKNTVGSKQISHDKS